MKIQFISFLLLILFVACAQPQTNQNQDIPISLASAEIFGEIFEATGVISVEKAVDGIKTEEPVELKVSGEITSVCQSKGCWMKLDIGDGREMRVKFKDYAFFVPLDVAGRKVVLNGSGFMEMTSVKTLRHYAEDAGKSPEEIAAITEPKAELVFLASGVAILPEEG